MSDLPTGCNVGPHLWRLTLGVAPDETRLPPCPQAAAGRML
jgi:hypothetical protein